MVGAAGGMLRRLENAAKVYFLPHSGFVFYSKYKPMTEHEWALKQGPSLWRENVVLLTGLRDRFPETGGI